MQGGAAPKEPPRLPGLGNRSVPALDVPPAYSLLNLESASLDWSWRTHGQGAQAYGHSSLKLSTQSGPANTVTGSAGSRC